MTPASTGTGCGASTPPDAPRLPPPADTSDLGDRTAMEAHRWAHSKTLDQLVVAWRDDARVARRPMVETLVVLTGEAEAGKKKMRQFGKVDIPQEAFISALKMDG